MKLFKRKYLLIAGILITGLVFLNALPSVSGSIKNIVFKAFSPLQIIFIKTGNKVTNFFEIISSIRDLGQENLELKKKNIALESQLLKLVDVKKENEVLRNALNFPPKNVVIHNLASIVGKEIGGEDGIILINLGRNQGIENNFSVISEEMALVGKIIDVEENFSKVIVITNPQSTVAVAVNGKKIEGLLHKEKENGELVMDFVPREENVELEDKIITSGMDNIYPAGIFVGNVKNINNSENQLFQKIIVEPAVNFNKLEKVFVIKAK